MRPDSTTPPAAGGSPLPPEPNASPPAGFPDLLDDLLTPEVLNQFFVILVCVALRLHIDFAGIVGDPDEGMALEASEFLAGIMPLYFREGSPQHRSALAEVARLARQEDVPPAAVVRRELVAGIQLALGARDEPQRILIGHRYLRDEQGGPLVAAPEQLHVPLFSAWLSQRARRLALDALAPPRHASVNPTADGVDALADDPATSDPALILLARGADGAGSAGIRELLSRVRPKEREIVLLASEGRDREEIAALLGMRRNAVRQALHRIRGAM